MKTASWPQFAAGPKVNHNLASDPSALHPSSFAGAVSTSSTANTSVESTAVGTSLLRSLPPDSAQADTTTMKVSSGSEAAPADPAHIPRRNLSEAFEELYIAPTDTPNNNNINTATPADKESAKMVSSTNLISPTGVADLHVTPPPASKSKSPETVETSNESTTTTTTTTTVQPPTTAIPFFKLHGDLQRDLSQAVINRVSFYGIIHDINKEATAMAANDDSGLNRAPIPGEDITEDHSPLVEAVKGPCANRPEISSNMMQAALIDEEKWLLSAIEKRGDDESRPMQSCPPTFLQAMGEREYENPLTSLSSGSRTQLWKPSRSWWEAKSGKNPWIEPKSHNKRWRYLWPLIHYHKFLAKCIKKLKRNGVDVKMSVSPVAAFLREEVCAVSDHLAAVSLFDSEEWMSCLQHFSGWTDTTADSEARLRLLVSKLFLRPLAEHGDIESPLLRSQIDEQFLRAMAAARSQMVDMGSEQDRYKHGGKSNVPRPPHQARNLGPHGHMESRPPHMHPVPNHVGGPPRGNGVRRPRYPYSHQWWGQGWHQSHSHHQYGPPYGDDASVHSSLSGDAFSEYGMYQGGPGPSGQYYPPVPYHHPHMEHLPHGGGYDPSMPPGDPSMYSMHTPYHPDHAGLGFFGHAPVDPSVAYPMHHHEDMGGYYGMPTAALPKSPQEQPSPAPSQQPHMASESNTSTELIGGVAGDQTPYKYDPSKTPRSPYWGHLDATIAMGLSTPQTHAKPQESVGLISPDEGAEASCLGNAQPLLLRQSQYYGYGPVNNYGPPSPATQFMMSPQANFAFNYGYGYSPSHAHGSHGHGHGHGHGHVPSHFKQSPATGSSHVQGTNFSSLQQTAPGFSPAAPRSKTKTSRTSDDRESPSTVETITESESLSEAT